MTAGHFVFIPAVLLVGLVIGWILGARAAGDAYAVELKRRGRQAARSEPGDSHQSSVDSRQSPVDSPQGRYRTGGTDAGPR